MTRSALALVISFGIAGQAWAQTEWTWTAKESRVVDQLEKKVKAKGERFEVEGQSWTVETEVSARFTAETAAFMDLFSETFTSFLKAKVCVPVRPRVCVFSSEARYREIIKDGSRGRFRWAQENDKFTEFTLYTFIKEERERDFARFYQPILQHEGSHAILRTYLGFKDVPPWFDEGVATYYQFWDLRSDVKANKAHRYERSIYKTALKEMVDGGDDKMLRLKDLLAISSHGWNPDSMGPTATKHYALGEGLMDFLQTTEPGQKYFKGVFDAILKEAAPFSDKEMEKVEGLWRQHLKSVASR